MATSVITLIEKAVLLDTLLYGSIIEGPLEAVGRWVWSKTDFLLGKLVPMTYQEWVGYKGRNFFP